MLHDLFTNCAHYYNLCVVQTGACPVVCNREFWVIDFGSMPTSAQIGVCSRHVTQLITSNFSVKVTAGERWKKQWEF